MSHKTAFIALPLLLLLALALLGHSSETPETHFEERVMVALLIAVHQR